MTSHDIIGHSDTLGFLQSAMESGKLTHAYLLAGPVGVGKTAVARWLVGSVLGTESLESHPDFAFVERGENAKTGKLQNAIVIEQIHGLRGRIALGPMMGGWKTAILSGADRMNDAAANALLKTLEEPGPRTLIVLTAETAEAVLPTVRSRCQVIRLVRVPRTEIVEGLVRRGIDRTKADLAARLSGGCPGRSITLSADRAVLDELVERRDRLMDITESRLSERWPGLEREIPEKVSFNEARDAMEETLGLLSELLRDAVWIGQGLEDRMVHVDRRDRLAAWTERFGLKRLVTALEETDSGRRQLAANVSPKTVAGLVAISLSGL
ncbi:hypothetical protein JW899_03570 [Candidatus Uhrbacteria bacterium]|nr:hypothetical protein [Candidatus Uhrbacteria bacterium]